MASPPSLPARRIREPRSIELLELAERVLADDGVRSLTIDAAADEATVLYRDCSAQRASVGWLAEQLRDDTAGLRATAVSPASETAGAIECWTDDETGRSSYIRSPEEARGWRRVMHLSLAGLWFSLAVLGAILPGVPCTCFLLLTSYSLCRSSKRLHQRLLDSRWFGPTLHRWRVHRGVRPGVKTKALTMLVAMVGLSLAFAPLPTVAWWIVAALGAAGATCIARLRVIRG